MLCKVKLYDYSNKIEFEEIPDNEDSGYLHGGVFRHEDGYDSYIYSIEKTKEAALNKLLDSLKELIKINFDDYQRCLKRVNFLKEYLATKENENSHNF